ncbi:MAG TPA: lipase maturation factor family protein [Burkholderiales bacterium]|nr:lipase maturation factor family protein [Burkholderiales bacterium]
MRPNNPDSSKPTLIYDGDCGFCAYWARYWQKLTQDRVNYEPYQRAASRFPKISVAEFQRAVQYIASDGKIASAAEASFLTLSHARGKGFWLLLYRKLPGFAKVSERAYALIASHRPAFHRFSLWLWGRDFTPPRFQLVIWFFMRAIGLIYLAAFVSIGVQALGLIGSHGILPLSEFIDAIKHYFGVERYWLFPMVFWLASADLAIQVICWAGAALSLLLVFNILPRLCLLLLYALYLSLFYAGQDFMTFQWDLLLLECGFLAVLLSVTPQIGIWLLRWLLFRFMFLSGAVKLLSGDSTWRSLSALSYHFQTQPLPTPIAWYADHLSHGVLMIATAATFVIELVLPFFIFFPRRLRFGAAFGFLLLQICISLTGNYNFFNLLTMVLCLLLFDDAALQRVLPQRLVLSLQQRNPSVEPGKIISFVSGFLALLIVFVSSGQLYATFSGRMPAPVRWAEYGIAPLRFVNTYGVFAVMTTERPEIIIEGSNDGVQWKEYAFKFKPGDVKRRPPWNIPHQPRLDWQMWFAALGTPSSNPWFSGLLQRLLENSQDVVALLDGNPFPDRPPRYLRALLYQYRFSSPEEKQTEGIWWQRKLSGFYYPAVELAPERSTGDGPPSGVIEGITRPRQQ